MTIRLIVRVPRGSTTEVTDHSFTRSEILVGRSPECDLVMPGDEVRVSRQHIRIAREANGYRMYDLGSRNGTLLNNAVVESKGNVLLVASDTIRMGSVELQVAGIKLDNPEVNTKMRVKRDPLAAAALRAIESVSDHFLGGSDFENEQQVILFGEMIRMALDQLLEGLFQMLNGRREFEQEFDAFVSMALQREANPIKQKRELDDFRRFPLDWRTTPELTAVKDAIARAIKDVSQHQVGLLAGMQQVLDSVIEKMNPAQIKEESKKEAGLIGKLRGGATAWSHYCSVYDEFLKESSKLFNETIYPNLQKGYLLSHKEKTAIYTTGEKLSRMASGPDTPQEPVQEPAAEAESTPSPEKSAIPEAEQSAEVIEEKLVPEPQEHETDQPTAEIPEVEAVSEVKTTEQSSVQAEEEPSKLEPNTRPEPPEEVFGEAPQPPNTDPSNSINDSNDVET